MQPVLISLPENLLTFLAVVAAVWTLASVFVVFLALRAMGGGATKQELAQAEQRFSNYTSEARASRDDLQRTVQSLSREIHGVLGELRAGRGVRRHDEES